MTEEQVRVWFKPLGVRLLYVHITSEKTVHIVVPDTPEIRETLTENNRFVGELLRIDLRYGGLEQYHSVGIPLISIQYNTQQSWIDTFGSLPS